MKISKKSKLKTAESFFLFEALIVAIKILTELETLDSLRYNLLLGYAAITFSHLVRALRFKPIDKFTFIRYIGLAGIFAASTMIMSLTSDWISVNVMYISYGISIMYSRVVTIVDKRKAVSTIWNVLLVLIAVMLALVPFTDDEESILSHVGVGCHLWLLGTCEVADVTKAFSIVISLRVNFRSHPWHLYWTEQPRACSYLAGGQPVCGACRGALITVNASV